MKKNCFSCKSDGHSQVTHVQYHNLHIGQERMLIREGKARDLTLKQGNCHIVVKVIYLLSDKEFTVFIPSRDIK